MYVRYEDTIGPYQWPGHLPIITMRCVLSLCTSSLSTRECIELMYQSKTSWIHYLGIYGPHSSTVILSPHIIFLEIWGDRIPLLHERKDSWRSQTQQWLGTSFSYPTKIPIFGCFYIVYPSGVHVSYRTKLYKAATQKVALINFDPLHVRRPVSLMTRWQIMSRRARRTIFVTNALIHTG